MSRSRLARWLPWALASLFLLLPLAVFAQEDEGEDKSEGRSWGRKEEPEDDLASKMPAAGAKFRERHAKAINLYFEEKYDEAEQELGKIFLKRLNITEKGMLHEAYAYIANGRGDRAEARRRLQLALESNGILPDRAPDLVYQIAMLFIGDQMWKESAQVQEAWFGMSPNPNARAYYILALTYYNLDKHDKALPAAQKAVDLGDPPEEGWLQMLLALNLVNKKYEDAIPVLEEMISLYPKKEYYTNLSTVYGALGSYEDAAVPLQLAYDHGFLDSDQDLRRVAQLMLFLNLPYRAAEILQQGLDEGVLKGDTESLAMLSNSWIAAREYEASVAPLEEAAALAPDGELFVRLAQVHLQRENWNGATGALRKALEKGGLRAPGDANLLMGIALYSQERREQARNWFRRARGFQATKAEADVWLNHIDQELLVLEAQAEEDARQAAEKAAAAADAEAEAAAAESEQARGEASEAEAQAQAAGA